MLLSYVKIKTKIIAGNLVFLCLFLLFSAGVYGVIRSTGTNADIIDTGNAVMLHITNARVAEYQFFLTRSIQYADKNFSDITEAISALNKIVIKSKDEVFRHKIKTLTTVSRYYAETFGEVVQLHKKLGLSENEGEYGALRTASHTMEKSFGSNDITKMISLLLMRRHEKDYMLRKDTAYIQKFSDESMKLRRICADRPDLLKTLDEYMSKFYTYYALDVQIKDYRIEFEEYVKKIEPALTDYRTYLLMIKEKNKKMAIIIFITGIVLFLALIIIVSLLLTTSIIRPIQNAISTLKDIANGNGDLTRFLPLRPVTHTNFNCDFIPTEVAGYCFFSIGTMSHSEAKGSCNKIIEGKVQSCLECPLFLYVSNDEMTESALWINYFIMYLRSTVRGVKTVFNKNTQTYHVLQKIITTITDLSRDASDEASENNSKFEQLKNDLFSAKKSIDTITNMIDSITDMINNEAAAINQSSASIEEIAASINSIYSTMEQRKSETELITQNIGDGQDKINALNNSMELIVHSAENIGEITTVIKEIADKTDILSMNASIEAAHAGTYGKGFSVVADEIRHLANQAEENVHSISSLISRVLKEIKDAGTITDETVFFFDKISGDVSSITSSFDEMEQGMAEIKAGSNEIVTAITSIINLSENIRNNELIIDTNIIEVNSTMQNVTVFFNQVVKSLENETATISEITGEMKKFNELFTANDVEFRKLQENLDSIRTE